MKKEEIINGLVANGATVVNNLAVANATVNYNGNLEQGFVNLKFDKPVKTMVDGEEKEVDYANISLISACASLKDVVGSGAYHHIKQNPFALEDMYDGAIVSIVQEKVEKDKPYKNPFSDSDKVSIPQLDTIYNHIVDTSLGKDGKALVKQIKMFRNFGGAIISSL